MHGSRHSDSDCGGSSGRGGFGDSGGLSLNSLFGDRGSMGGLGGFGGFGAFGGGCNDGMGLGDSFGMGMRDMLSGFSIDDNGFNGSTIGRTIGMIGGALLQGALSRFANGNMQDLCGSCRHLDQGFGSGRFDDYGGGRFDNNSGQCNSDYSANMPHGFRNRVPRMALQRVLQNMI